MDEQEQATASVREYSRKHPLSWLRAGLELAVEQYDGRPELYGDLLRGYLALAVIQDAEYGNHRPSGFRGWAIRWLARED